MEDGSQREDIANRFGMLRVSKSYNFRGDVAWSSTSEEEVALEIRLGG
jgi:hypothetical protein